MNNSDNNFNASRLPFFEAGEAFDSTGLDFYKFAVDVAADEVFLMLPTSEIIYVNRSACKKLGYEAEELIGKFVWEWDPLFPQSAWPGFWSEFLAKKHLRFETQHMTKVGNVFPVEIHAHFYKDDNNEYLLAFVQDLSEKKKLEKEKLAHLKLAKEKAEETNAAKSQFLANISHELRTPMHAIHGFANLGLKHTKDHKVEKYLQNIRTSGIRLTSLLNDLLDLSKLEAEKMKADFLVQDLTTLINNTINEVGILLSKKGIAINFNAEKHFDCMIDQKLFTQVMVNLLSNAIKFSEEQSVIEIEIESINTELSDKFQDVLQISVMDSGIGIPSDELETIFNPFEQSSKTRSGAGGTGLGLPISRQIIQLHYGRIWAESPPDNRKSGSIFYVQIPVEQDIKLNID